MTASTVEYTRECQTCHNVETIVEETDKWTTEQWSNFQKNLYAPYVCRKCLENTFSWE